MAAITSTATGNFADGSTWVGGVAPTAADTFVVAAGHEVTVAADVTSAGGTVESLQGGGLINNAKLTMNGVLTIGNGLSKDGCFTFGSGSELVLNGASVELVLNNARLRNTSTSGSWAKVTGAGDIARGAVYTQPKQDIILNYVSFQQLGQTQLSANGAYGSASLTNQVDCNHCAVIGGTNIFIGAASTPGTTNLKFNNSDIRDYTGSLCIFGATKTTGVREFKYNTCSISSGTTVRGMSVTDCADLTGTVFDRVKLNGSDYLASMTGKLYMDGCFFGSGINTDDFTNTFGIRLRDNAYIDGSYVYVPPGATNPHTMGIASDARHDGNVYEVYGTEPNVITSGTTTITGTVSIVNNLCLGSGAFFSQVGDCTANIVNVLHNTVYTVANSGDVHQGLFLAENGNMTGTLNLKSNLHAVKSGVSLSRSCWDNDETAQAINADYNNFYGLSSTPYESSLSVTGATNDTDVDPQFVDATRSLTAWGDYIGVAETYAAAVGELLRMNGYDATSKTQSATPSGVKPADLVAWVRAGFAPTNSALEDAGHDGVTIGAMEYVSADDTSPVLTSATATATDATTATASVSTDDGNGTLYFLASTNATESASTVKAALSQSVTAAGAQSISLSALDPETTYYVHFVQINGAGLESASVVSTSAITTPAIVYPEISATVAASSTSAVSATITTDTAGGTIYGVLSESATEMEAADIKSGADDSATVTDTGGYTLNETGLATWTQYYWHIVHEDVDGLMSNVLTIPVRTLDISIPLAFSDTAPATLLGVQVWSKVPKKADVEGLY